MLPVLAAADMTSDTLSTMRSGTTTSTLSRITPAEVHTTLGRYLQADGLDLVPGDFSYRNMDLELDGTKRRTRRLGQLLNSVRADYDVVMLDCPPSVSLVSENVLWATDVLLVPLVPATLSVRTFDQLTRFVADAPGNRPDVIAFFSMADRRKKLHRALIESLGASGTKRARVAGTVIPALSVVEQMAEHRAPVAEYAPRSAAAAAYAALWAEVSR